MLDFTVHDSVATVVLDREPVNAMNDHWVERFHAILDVLDARTDWAVLHLRSAHRVFSAGADLRQMKENYDSPIEDQLDVGRRYQRLFARIENMARITFAEIGGAALGGGLELALACDLRIAATTAKLGLPEVTLGLIPGAGGTQRVTWLCGRAVASRLILSGEVITGVEGQRLGLVQWCAEPERVATEALQLVRRYANIPVHAAKGAKAAIAAAADSARDGFHVEVESVRICLQNAETRSRIARFLDRQ